MKPFHWQQLLCYCYREDKGVKVRVELGPRDAQARKACLALCKKPGEVADKSFLQVGESFRNDCLPVGGSGCILPGTAAGSRSFCNMLYPRE